MTDLETTRDHLRLLADSDHRGDCYGTVRDRWGPRIVRPDPKCAGCLSASDRALAARLADEIDDHLAPDDEGQETLL